MNALTRIGKLLAAPALLCAAAAIAATSFAGGHDAMGDSHSKHTDKVVKNDIVDVAIAAGQFNTLAAALQAADLVDTLKGDGPFTVFAPTDEAFSKLPAGTVESLLLPENKDKLVSILTYHVVPGNVLASQVVTLKAANTVNGDSVDIQVSKEGVMVDGANVLKTDIKASNGVIHVIDAVIMPN